MFAAVLAATLDRSGVEPEVGPPCPSVNSKPAQGRCLSCSTWLSMMQCVCCAQGRRFSQLSLLQMAHSS